MKFRRVRAWLDPVFSPGRVGGEDWQSSSFSGGVFIERKASPNEWHLSFYFGDRVSLIDKGRVRALARYGLRS